MTVPINTPDFDSSLHLCYEILGAPNNYFNFVSDECTSVNAHYASVPGNQFMNIIDSMSFVAVDNQGTCHRISVNATGCSATVDGDIMQPSSTKRSRARFIYEHNGISVHSYSSRVRISVPNCADNTLVMWMVCKQQPFHDTFTGKLMAPVDIIKFEITHGLNLNATSHGLLGTHLC